MSKPVTAVTHPVEVALEAGQTYYWCTCGRSRRQPFCDGSHQGTGFTPLAFKAERSERRWLCQCKRTGTPPFCDGSHDRLFPETVEKTFPEKPSVQPTAEEPTLQRIHHLARHGLEEEPQGELAAMGVPQTALPGWEDIQILTAQLARRPLADNAPVATRLVIGPRAEKPLELEIPLLVSDMSFGALSREAKIALARGAELAGTAIGSGEGGVLPEELEANRRYLFELGPAMYGYDEALLTRIRAFHFKAGQGAKTGVGGHLPGSKVTEEIARLRGLEPGRDAISPPTFVDLETPADFRRFADRVRELSGGIPVGMKLSANRLEADLDFALQAGVDYLILDGRGGGTGAAPRILRDHTGIPTIAALARARRHLDRHGAGDITLIVAGGLRLPEDFFKALALGADGVALGSAALQAIGCVAARICHTNQCPSGIATQDPALRAQLDVDEAALRLARFLAGSVELMKLLARASGHADLARLGPDLLTSWKRETAELAGIAFAGASG